MRGFLAIVLTGLFLTGCASKQAYAAQDFQQVKAAWTSLKPVYLQFRSAFTADRTTGILRAYHRERRICLLVDAIDRRDSIDPNTRLFQASSNLDVLCNTIESVENMWAKKTGYPYDKRLPLADPPYFVYTDAVLLQMPFLLKHPAAPS